MKKKFEKLKNIASYHVYAHLTLTLISKILNLYNVIILVHIQYTHGCLIFRTP